MTLSAPETHEASGTLYELTSYRRCGTGRAASARHETNLEEGTYANGDDVGATLARVGVLAARVANKEVSVSG